MNLPSLTSLTIEEAGVSDAGLDRIATLPLEEIGISRCYSVTDAGFRHFARMSVLRELAVRGIPLTARPGPSGRQGQTGRAAVERDGHQ